MIYKIYIFFIFFSIALCRNLNNSINFIEHKFCYERIYSDSDLYSEEEIKSLCSQMKIDDRYLLLLTNKDIDFDDEDYQTKCNVFGFLHCNHPMAKCPYVFTVCIFLNHNKVFFYSGYKVRFALKDYEKSRIKNISEKYLEKKEYYNATIYILNEIDLLYLRYALMHGFGSSSNLFTYFFKYFLILFCVGLCYFIYKLIQKRKEELPYTRLIDHPNYDLNNINNDLNDEEKVILIHDHLTELERLFNEINKNEKIEIRQCLICMKRIAYISNIPGSSGITRFNCHFLHAYHTFCLNKYNLKGCLMCKDINNDAYKINTICSTSYYINLEDVKNFIKNLKYIYPQKMLSLYKYKYPNEFNSLDNNIMNGLLSNSWGLSNIEINNNNRTNINNNNRFQQKQKNIEMKEF